MDYYTQKAQEAVLAAVPYLAVLAARPERAPDEGAATAQAILVLFGRLRELANR